MKKCLLVLLVVLLMAGLGCRAGQLTLDTRLPYEFTGVSDNWSGKLVVRKVTGEDMLPDGVTADYCTQLYLTYMGIERYLESLSSVSYSFGEDTPWADAGEIVKQNVGEHFEAYLTGREAVSQVYYDEAGTLEGAIPSVGQKFHLSLKVHTTDGKTYYVGINMDV